MSFKITTPIIPGQYLDCNEVSFYYQYGHGMKFRLRYLINHIPPKNDDITQPYEDDELFADAQTCDEVGPPSPKEVADVLRYPKGYRSVAKITRWSLWMSRGELPQLEISAVSTKIIRFYKTKDMWNVVPRSYLDKYGEDFTQHLLINEVTLDSEMLAVPVDELNKGKYAAVYNHTGTYIQP